MTNMDDSVLIDTIGAQTGVSLRLKQVALVLVGIVALAICAKIQVPMWPVPITMGTFAVLTIGAAYGPSLGFTTILGYMLVGALGFDVFASSSAESSGPSYMMGTTGGYLLGYVLATLALGLAARKGWDRSIFNMALAMVIGTALIYIPGLFWLGQSLGWDKPILAWGLTPFLVGDVIKLALAAVLFPAIWRFARNAPD